MKLSIDQLNKDLRQYGFSFRAISERTITPAGDLWIAQEGLILHVRDEEGVSWVSSSFRRFMRFGNGQLFEMTAGDLVHLSLGERVALAFDLTQGLAEFLHLHV